MRSREQNVAIGQKSKIAGALFETWIEGQHEIAKSLGILAHAMKNEPKTEIIKGRLIHSEKSGADFSGTLEGGRSLAEEAKSRGERLNRRVIEPKQQEHLEAVARAGGLALLLVEFTGEICSRFSIPWLEVPWQVLRSAETIGPEDIPERWKIEAGTQCYLEKFHPRGTPRNPVRGRIFPRE